jgi:hypothetical protein
MKIEHGLMQGQVLQRNVDGVASVFLRGRCKGVGTIQFRVKGARKRAGISNWQSVGEAIGSRFEVRVEGLPTGGPYQVEFRIVKGRKILSTCFVDDVFVGDVWVLAGQSNMEGVGNLCDAPKPNPRVRAFYMRDEWGIAEEKLHYLAEAVDTVHNSYGDEPGRPPKSFLNKGRKALIKGTSPGLAFGIEMLKRTRVPQGLIPCAHGGTSMTQWSPALREKGGASLYGAMLRRHGKLGQPIAGVLWYQGESDANSENAAQYTGRMQKLVAATRHDMQLPFLPWFVVQIGCHASPEPGNAWNAIQEQQRLLPTCIDNLDVATAVDLELDDGIHISGKAQHILGRRLARLANRHVHQAKGVKAGIYLKHIALVPTPTCNPGATCMSISIAYGNVVKRLQSPGKPTGFCLMNANGDREDWIYKISLEGSSILLHTGKTLTELKCFTLCYGYGRMPYCNITDMDGMAIPAMQAVPLPAT